MNADLRSADLSGADLSDANLSGAKLAGATLSTADLRGAVLRCRTMLHAMLFRMDLSEGARIVAALRQTGPLYHAIGLKREQVDKAYIDGNTQLPAYLQNAFKKAPRCYEALLLQLSHNFQRT